MIWDPCLARAVAEEVQARLGGKRAVAVEFLRERRTVRVHFREATLVADLTPGRSVVVVRPASEPGPGAERLPATLARATAVGDERIVVLRFRRVRGKKAHPSLILEFAANRWNALWAEGEELVVRRRLRGPAGFGKGSRGAAGSGAVIGRPWTPPRGGRRAGADGKLGVEDWLAEWPFASGVAATGPGGASGEVAGVGLDAAAVRRWTSRVAYVSAINAPWLLAAGDPEAAFDRWRILAEGSGTTPCLLRLPSGVQPYPWPLGAEARATPVDGLLDGMEAVLAAAENESGGESGGAGAPASAVDQRDPEAEALDREARRLERKLAALRGQMERAGRADRLREEGALILASLRQIERGAGQVVLTGFDGETWTLDMDPALPPHENADARFRLAARLERGAAKLARRISQTQDALERVQAAARLHRLGELPPEELEAVLPPAPKQGGRRAPDAPALPYRRYRTSGGLEVRVGRGARRNDDLTFRHSRPNDVWMHARHAGGAHVVLRWTRDERPPATDLEEAATLAANHSGARSSRHVPVDWTRRKWVRKPRGAPPGTVALERIETVFVSPDPAMEERLRFGAA